jgi:hypothetical protein
MFGFIRNKYFTLYFHDLDINNSFYYRILQVLVSIYYIYFIQLSKQEPPQLLRQYSPASVHIHLAPQKVINIYDVHIEDCVYALGL